MTKGLLNIANTIPHSVVNGPGERFVIWVQGCSLRCPGCWNPGTWSHQPRTLVRASDLIQTILATSGVEGITITGGEPFEQAAGLIPLVSGVRAAGLSVMVFTGFELDELNTDDQRILLAGCDVVVAGRYLRDRHSGELPWLGSANQTIHFLTKRYGMSSLPQAPECEIHISGDGTICLTGFPSSSWQSEGR
jgi:anaerobic ribonucleoside-triphosphate reductase activating protein